MAEKDDLRALMQKDKLIIGLNETKKALLLQQLAKVVLASNCAADTKADLEHLAAFQKIDVEVVKSTNGELGTLVKKPFAVAVIGIKK